MTESFAGTERYVSEVALETARQGCRVAVVGGSPTAMVTAVGQGVEWRPGKTLPTAVRELLLLGKPDIIHTHMTKAELAAVIARRRSGASVVTTRHIAARRGSSLGGRAIANMLAGRIDRQIATSQYVADQIETPADAVIINGVAPRASVFAESSRAVLLAQRLEPEKDTLTALRAWGAAGLWRQGWKLRVAGDGAQRKSLEQWVAARDFAASVTFLGWVRRLIEELSGAAMLVATCPVEGVGLSVLEAMAAGIPVVASNGGGHLETVGALSQARLFQAGDWRRCASLLAELAGDERARSDYGRALYHLQRAQFTLAGHVMQLLYFYEGALVTKRG